MSYDTSKVLFTATQLTLTGPSTATVVFVQNLAEPGDGLGGVFSWFPESEAADDGLNVFQPADTSGAGRWVRLSGEFVPNSTFTIPIEFAEAATFDKGFTANAPGTAASDIGAYGIATGSAVGVEGDAVNGVGVLGFANGTGNGGYFESDGSGAALVGDASAGTGYGVIAKADTTTPAKAALLIIPQNAAPSSSPAEGSVYENSVTHNLCYYDGTFWVESVRYAYASIAKADIIGTSAGQLGHANGVPIIVSPGAGYAVEFLSGVVILDFDTAAYTGGGNVTFTYDSGGATLSAAVTYANSVGGSADKIALVAAAVPTNNQLVANKGINLVCAGAPTDPGTAAGVVRVKIAYRVHTTGL